jgi:Putative auto-transporter adhesin, head GIN domain
MKTALVAILGLAIMAKASAQSKIVNDKYAQVRMVKGFHAIKVSSGIHLYLNQGNEEAVAVSASEEKYRNHIITEVDNGVLRIYFDNKYWKFWDNDKWKLKAYVSCKVLDALGISSGAEVEVDGSIKSGDLSMNLSSGANFSGNVVVTSLKVDQGSGAEANISGSASQLRVEASSGSSLKAFDLQTDLCDASISSGASLRVTVNKELSASAHSGGQIYYKGAGLIRDISTGSGGEVSRR